MILNANKDVMTSATTNGSVLCTKNGSLAQLNAVIAQVPSSIMGQPGTILIKGMGYMEGANNPNNTVADVLSLILSFPFLSQTLYPIFNRVFTKTTFFDFEISISTATGYALFCKLNFDDGSAVFTPMVNIPLGSSFDLGLELSTSSGLFTAGIYSVITEFKSLWEK